MDSVTARQLKNQTGKILTRVRRGERIQVTNRGKPVALIVPVTDLQRLEGDRIRSYRDAWEDIEQALAESPPEYESWQEALDRSRRRR